MKSCKQCQKSASNGGKCLEMISSNGSRTWYTPIFQDDDILAVTGEQHAELHNPVCYETHVDCAGWKEIQAP